MIRPLLVSAFLLAGVTAVVAQSDAISERKKLFKEMAGAVKGPGQMLKGTEPFDLAKVKAGLGVVAANAAKLPKLFPEGSDKGDTDALPAIWKNKDDFVARFAKLEKDATAAAAAIKDEATFKAELPKVLGNCGGCHKEYKKPS